MSGDPGDLANMADLALPEPIAFWPPAAGVSILGAAAAAMLAVAGWRALRRYRADAYLRRATAEIDALAGSNADVAGAISAILKRAAIIAHGREEVAALTGAGWSAFIARTTPAPARTTDLAAQLANLLGPQADSSAADRSALAAQAKAWLRGQHGRAAEGDRPC